MQNRELSWLTFNERVLDQGADETVPLLERLNFISIFWSNLQEFFMGARGQPDRPVASEEAGPRLEDGHDAGRAALRHP